MKKAFYILVRTRLGEIQLLTYNIQQGTNLDITLERLARDGLIPIGYCPDKYGGRMMAIDPVTSPTYVPTERYLERL